MVRPLRIEFKGAWYHVMNRGLAHRRIFNDDDDRCDFLRQLEYAWQRFGLEVHAYCLMDNHYHLLVCTPEGGLGRAMRHLNGVYTQYYNRRHDRDGPLFRGRYKAVLVDADGYWTYLSRYVHRNPLDAGIVDEPGAYAWSSYRYYADGRRRPPDWLTTEDVLAAFRVRWAYRHFVASDDVDSPLPSRYAPDYGATILGDDEFRARIMGEVSPDAEIPATRKRTDRPTIQAIIDAVARYYEEDPWRLRQPICGKGVRTPAKAVALYLGQKEAGYKLRELAVGFGLAGYASAGAATRNLRDRLHRDQSLRSDIKLILQDLTPWASRCVEDPYEDPNKKYCATGECAAGIKPNPNYDHIDGGCFYSCLFQELLVGEMLTQGTKRVAEKVAERTRDSTSQVGRRISRNANRVAKFIPGLGHAYTALTLGNVINPCRSKCPDNSCEY